MYVEWDFNIWVLVGLHMLMNGAWHVFSMEGTEYATCRRQFEAAVLKPRSEGTVLWPG